MNVGELLSRDQITSIRKLLSEGKAPKTIAFDFGKHVNTIYHIKRNKEWKGYDA
jgi:hypothetical protein